MSRAFVFPGQGSQAVGMGKDLAQAFASAREVFEEIDDALSLKLSQIMFEGPAETLTLTENAQPALMAVSLAVIRILAREADYDIANKVAYVAGHSLGEYSALAAAQALPISTTATLLRTRGQAMQKAVPVGQGAMAALLGLELGAATEVAQIASENEVCDVANDNAPGQIVVSGHKGAIERAVEIAKTKGAKRSILLPVSAPFHCRLMAPAADTMGEALAQTVIAPVAAPLIANVTASAVESPNDIRRLLVEQITGRVRWRESVIAMKAQGVDQLVECGAGRVLTGLTKRIDPDLAAVSLQTPADIESFIKGV
ncbi:MAG: ACP S-malonyltransferase [Alphaproteobacteria bacterium]